MAERRRPAGLGPRGRRFWRRVLAVFDLSDVESELLVEACRVLDAIDAMAAQLATDGLMVAGSKGQSVAHPLVAEVRQQRDLFGRLAGRLALPGEDLEESAAAVLGRRGAAARWYSGGARPTVRKGA